MNLPELLPYFDNWTQAGNGRYKASCPMPNHSDSDPSVSITQDTETGNILLYCWGCNTKGRELCQALGLPLSALFGDPGHPSAVKQMAQNVEVAPEDQVNLEQRVKTAMGRLDEAKDYLYNRFNLSVDDGKALGLGVDNDFGVEHLIIPFYDPSGKIVAMQGRRLVDGDPRWRSVSGGGWSKMGCFGWEMHHQGPVIITEGPSDALAVVGRAYLPAIAIRGASNTSPEVCEQIKDWLGDRLAVVIGDNDDAGERFSGEISNGVGIPSWRLPIGFSDLDSYLVDGNLLDEVITLATGTPAAEPVDTRTDDEIIDDFKIRIFNSPLTRAYLNSDLIEDLCQYPQLQQAIFAEVPREAPRHDCRIGDATSAIRDIRMAIRAVPAPGGHVPPGGGGGGVHAPVPDNFDPTGLPEIIWNIEDQLHITNHSIRDAMDAYDRGEFYRAASGQYVKIVGDDLVPLKEPGVKSMLSEMAHWRIINGQRETGHVPHDAARIITDPSWECGLPEIKRRVEVPFMLADGEVISNHGYHEESGIYLLPRTGDFIQVPHVPSIVTQQDVEEAKKIFEDVTEGFMFKDQASKSNLIGMTLTSPLRELFRSNPMVPLLTSTAPQSGSGKGTSIRVPLSTCGVGPYSLSTTAYNSDENEFEKKLVGKLLKKSTYIFLDNIRVNVSSSVLEQMLTAANYDGRTLGYSEVNALSTLVLWVCTLQSTGTFNRDLTRRCVPVELVKNYRGKWKHKNIEAYLAEKRGEMIWACFVAARAWQRGIGLTGTFDPGKKSDVRLDGYGGWTEVIGGILENVLGYEDFLGNLEGFRKSQDENGMTIDGILERWLAIYGDTPQPARMAIEDYEDPALHQLLNLHNPSTRQTINALTRLLDQQRGYIVNDTHIWEPIGLHPYGHEGSLKQYRCMPLPEED